MDIINELWYGNISPFEQCTRGDKRLKELLKLVARNLEELAEGNARKVRGLHERDAQHHRARCILLRLPTRCAADG